jgi:hypothetical protein
VSTLLAIDPGQHTGWAVFTDGMLLRAGTVHAPGIGTLTAKAGAILRDLRATIPGAVWEGSGVELVAVEEMRYYPGRAQSTPNDLLEVQAMAGVCTALGQAFRFVPAREWKGSVPKSISDTRTAARLTPAEQAIFTRLDDHGRDAVGIGVYILGRRAGLR